MFATRRRRLACMFALVLLAELALLCCASVHIAHHGCRGEGCAICACVRDGLRRSALAAPILTALAASVCLAMRAAARRCAVGAPSLFRLKVRLND